MASLDHAVESDAVFQLGIFLRAALPDYTAPCPNLKKIVKMLVKCLQICAHVFIDRPQNCVQTSFRSCAVLRPNFGHSRSKLNCARILVVRALDCAQFLLHPALFPTQLEHCCIDKANVSRLKSIVTGCRPLRRRFNQARHTLPERRHRSPR